MSWLTSILIAGAVFITGTEMPVSNNQNNITDKKNNINQNKTADETERFEQTYSFDPNGRIEVSNLNGSITVEAWDNPQIYLETVKIADTKERLSYVDIDIEAGQSNFVVKTDYGSWKNKNQNDRNRNYGKLEVNFRLKVPRTAVLDEIESVNGSVTVSNMTNYTEVSAVNGTVKANNLRGTAKLSTVNGSVNADFDELNNGSIISLGTVNGSVKLIIPTTANATLRADTVNGSINNEFGLPVRKGKYVGRDLYGRIGTGEVKIKLSSVNGGLSISRKNDGGTPNPAVNLLPQKSSDDFDNSFEMEFDKNFKIDMSRINNTIKNAVQNSEKVKISEKELAEIEKKTKAELTKIKPELERINAEAMRIAAESIDRKKLKEQIEAAANMTVMTDSLRLSRSPYIVEKKGSLGVEGIPNIKIEAENCSVIVRGWDKPQVDYSITREVRDSNAEAPRISVTNNKSKNNGAKANSDVFIKVINNDQSDSKYLRSRNNSVRVEIFVPKRSNLKITSQKEIRLEGVSGELDLNGGDGTINVRDSNGKLNVKNIDGTVRIIGFDGELAANSVDGDVYMEGNFSTIKSESVDGSVYLTLPDDANATLTTNGAVDFGNMKVKNIVSKEKLKTISVGNGGLKYNFLFTDGKLFVRPLSSMKNN